MNMSLISCQIQKLVLQRIMEKLNEGQTTHVHHFLRIVRGVDGEGIAVKDA